MRSSQFTGGGSVTLDAAAPIGEQRVTVRINAAALPTGVPITAELYVLDEGVEATVEPSDEPAEVADPPLVVPEVTIIRDDTGEVVPSTVTWSGQTPRERHVYAAIPLDCDAGAACERTYRIRVAAPSLAGDRIVPVEWLTQARLAYEGIESGCGFPANGRVEIGVDEPRLLAAETAGFAVTGPVDEAGDRLVARHITVSTDGAMPDAASVRISTLQVVQGDELAATPPWHQWVRVIPDNGMSPVADALVFKTSSRVEVLRGGTLDVPVLGGCMSGEACTRGYWVIFQSFPIAPDLALGRFTWTAAATASFAEPAESPPSISIRVDDLDSGLPGDVTVAASAAPVAIVSNKTPTALDVTVNVPRRPQPTNGLDAITASTAIINVSGRGEALTTEIEGGGPGPISGYFSGDGSANLVAHPFDACPAIGPCTVTFRLVGTFHRELEPVGSQRDDVHLNWGIELLGAPAGTTVTFGDLRELANPPSDLAWLLVPATLGLVVVGFVAVIRRRRGSTGRSP